MATTKPFRSGNSQAVRLPKGVAYENEDIELEIFRSGDVVTMYPKRKRTMAEFLEALDKLPKPAERWVREPIEIPIRPGWDD